ncbi:MAG TPA: protein kinase [Acidimicrobiales bacterium]|nr:protein kinase [Acidimicrobiales bacterium]
MAAAPVPDQLLGGRYARREQVGRGGFGVVWRAHDTLLRRDVAVKAIEFPAILDDAERAVIRAKVLREAQAAARLNHPGLVTVFDVIEEDGRPLIVMELVKAPTLADLVKREGPLAEQRVASIGVDVLDALGAAHREGIIHRDVKPANVMVSDSGHVQLGDFGIAAVIDDPKLTSSGNLAGSPSYMAPEQAENRPPTVATDLWGLGATLYFAVEGRPPFAEAGAIATLTSVVNTAHRPPERARALAPLLDHLLAKDPSARPGAAETARRLTEVRDAAAPPEPDDQTATAEFAAPYHPEPEPPRPSPPPPSPPPSPSPPVGAPEPVVATEARPEPVAPPVARVEPQSPPARRAAPWRSLVPVLVALVAVAAVVLAAVLLSRDNGKGTSAAVPGSPTTSGRTATTGSAPTTATAASADVPKDWVAYRDPATGYTIAHPPDWTVSTNGTLTDIRSPSSGAYLRIDHREPPGPSPEGAWRDFEPTFAAQNPNYERLQITPTTYQGYPAAIWEYTYGAGAGVRAVDLGFIAGNHGFALNFQTPASDWDRSQPVFAAFKASFKAPTS